MNFKKLISIYSYSLFILLMVLAFITAYPIFLLTHLWSKKPRIYFQKIVQQYFRLFYKIMPLVGNITIQRQEIVNAFHPCIYVATHQSSLDYTLLATLIDDYVTPSNNRISDYPLFMKVPRHGLGVYYIPHGVLSQAVTGFNSFKKALHTGSCVLIFPEGTRNASHQLKPFKGGAFRLAIEEQVPVVPIIINGTGSIVTKGSNITKTLNKKEITITFLDPIYANADETFMRFAKRVQHTMQKAINITPYSTPKVTTKSLKI